MFALLADQVRSRSDVDRVPAALAVLAPLPLRLGFERTAGDEIQGLADDPASVVDAVVRLTRLDGWRIGIGIGPVDGPLPSSTRAARGPAYLAARAAIGHARHATTDLAVVLDPTVGGSRYGDVEQAARDAESALWLLRSLLQRRTEEGWELMDLLDAGLTNAQAAASLGVSPSAVSQRLGRSYRQEQERGTELAGRLLTRVRALGDDGGEA
jgi:hypothetical protein